MGKQTFGDALKLLFEAYYEDLASKEVLDYYNNIALLTAVKSLSPKWKRECFQQFQRLANTIKSEILTCRHEDKITTTEREECAVCGAQRTWMKDHTEWSYLLPSGSWTYWDIY